MMRKLGESTNSQLLSQNQSFWTDGELHYYESALSSHHSVFEEISEELRKLSIPFSIQLATKERFDVLAVHPKLLEPARSFFVGLLIQRIKAIVGDSEFFTEAEVVIKRTTEISAVSVLSGTNLRRPTDDDIKAVCDLAVKSKLALIEQFKDAEGTYQVNADNKLLTMPIIVSLQQHMSSAEKKLWQEQFVDAIEKVKEAQTELDEAVQIKNSYETITVPKKFASELGLKSHEELERMTLDEKRLYAKELENKVLPEQKAKLATSQAKLDEANKELKDLEPWSKIGYLKAFNGLCNSWEDKELLSLGQELWPWTYKALNAVDSEELITDTIGSIYKDAHRAKRMGAEAFTQFAAAWSVHAFQKMVTDHKYAAALMCSDTAKEVLEDLEIQWKAFMICVPNGLLRFEDIEGHQIEYTRILVHIASDNSARIIIYDTSWINSWVKVISHRDESLADVLFDEPSSITGSEDAILTSVGYELRAMKLAKRLVTGMIFALQNTDNFKQSNREPNKVKGKGRQYDEPTHRTVIVGAPIKVDCRPAVQQYLSRQKSLKHGPASVQVLVRGHQKRQVCGVGRKGRKVILVEPYWRGPDDAPILTRPKKLG
jgi:hypothetical protein